MSLSPKKLGNFGLRFLYFSRFITTAIPAQALLCLVFLRRSVAPPAKVCLYLFLVASYWVSVFAFGYRSFQLQNLLFYFSFIPALLVLFSIKSNITPVFITKKFITVITILTIIEALIVNSPLNVYLKFLYREENVTAFTEFLGFYRRPLGIGGNASMTSCVLIFSAALFDSVNKLLPDGKINHRDNDAFFTYTTLCVTITVFILASGTGFCLLLLYFVSKLFAQLKLNKKNMIRMAGVAAVIGLAVFGSIRSEDAEDFNKFSFSYARLIYDMKSDDIISNLENQSDDTTFVLFGRQIDPEITESSTSGDFGYLTMYGAIGLLGSLLVLLSPFLFRTSLWKFATPTFFFYTSFVHYAGLLSPPGAVLFAVYLYQLYRYSRVNFTSNRSICAS